VVPKYDNELRDLILKQFHDQANHREYHKTYSAIAEKHIGTTQAEVKHTSTIVCHVALIRL